nr:hypothetical protein BJQ95_00274 [Cryobacterium sp. SO1]
MPDPVHDQLPPKTTALHTEYAPANTVTVAPFSPCPSYGPAAAVSVAPAPGFTTAGAAGASTSMVSETGSLAGDDSGALNEVCCKAVTCSDPLVSVPCNRQAHAPDASAVNEQRAPPVRVAVTVAPGYPVPRTMPFVVG